MVDYNITQEWTPGKMVELSTELEKPSPFYFGYDIKEHFLKELSKHEIDKIFFFCEQNMFGLYGEELFHELNSEYRCLLEMVPAGEKSKYFSVLEQICETLVNEGVSKKSLLIAFGGGTVGNVVGLVAGLIYRGIHFVEVSTTMTGITDSTLSNKQAVNGLSGKNHFGIYHSPLFIWADTKYLKTEPAFSKRCGIIEGIKNGFIAEPTFLDYLDKTLNPELNFSQQVLTDLAYKIILSKLEILKKDPTEKHYGIILEYGHTFGHGLEWLLKGKLSHGEAVSYGMKIVAELGQELGFMSQADVDLHHHFIDDKLGFNHPWPEHVTTDLLMKAMIADNKKTGDDLRFVMLEKIGQCYNPEGDYLMTVDNKTVEKVLDNYIKKATGKVAVSTAIMEQSNSTRKVAVETAIMEESNSTSPQQKSKVKI
ncbi:MULTISPECIES: 3-dehydroquinate synthase family protein [Okeania]|uniref:Uncharacterized protein n=1 Tax=Okeania hirsuta TaxID=1458930 RepID=A0A3N6PFC1_9CYAN|nr:MULTISPECIES: hypothetical protein [Okeania]NET76525.1 hypothetical protein [Okeania sp. SIO1F9]RQH24290.1 hypothetical protein D4Z78_04135 [Okeania hirsuta]RQH45435.1 hypothetical protein D5R40_10605 [Okeania hirsuta]